MDRNEEAELKQAIRRLTNDFHREAAATRIRTALNALRHWAEKAGFDPNQPRVPAAIPAAASGPGREQTMWTASSRSRRN